jgi:CubicO group peptidase (beta-lactamase class C family)
MTKRHNGFLMLLMILMLGLSPAFASTKAPTPKPVNLKGFGEFVAKTMAEWKVPGMAVAIVKDGKVIFAEGFGFRDVERGLKVTPHTIFPIGSCSKAFTAADVGILVDEGKVGWDEPVRTYLPDFKLQDEYASEHATPRDLLSHRTGLPRHDLMWIGGQFDRRELYDRIRYLEMNKEFRSTWQYQNLMFMTAGYLVGKVDGSSWEDFTQKKILDPLGMKETNFSVALTQKAADFSRPYMEIKDKIEPVPYRDITAVGPAGSINSNVLDMAQWVLMNLNKGKFGDKQVVSEASMAQIHSPQMLIPVPIRYDEVLYPSYGMGWVIEPYRGHLLVWHNGGIDGFISQVAFLPRENAGLVILSNLNETPLPPIVSNNIIDRLLGLDQVDWNKRTRDDITKGKAEDEKAKKEEDKDRKLDTRPSHPLADYAGDYENPAYGTFSVAKDADGLKLKTPLLEGPLSHYHYDVFELKALILGTEMKSKVAFANDLKGNIASFSVPLEPSVKDIVFTRAADKGMSEKGFLEKFVGTYILSGAEVNVVLREGKGLVLTVPGQPDYELVPYRGTEFNLKGVEGYSVEFKQDAAGAVTEVLVHQPNGTFPAKKK